MRLAILLLALVLSGCASASRNSSEREWARAECDRIIDREARERCFRRLDEDYGGTHEPTEKSKSRK